MFTYLKKISQNSPDRIKVMSILENSFSKGVKAENIVRCLKDLQRPQKRIIKKVDGVRLLRDLERLETYLRNVLSNHAFQELCLANHFYTLNFNSLSADSQKIIELLKQTESKRGVPSDTNRRNEIVKKLFSEVKLNDSLRLKGRLSQSDLPESFLKLVRKDNKIHSAEVKINYKIITLAILFIAGHQVTQANLDTILKKTSTI